MFKWLKKVFAITQPVTYYVSPTGSDTNNGTTTTTPWQTLGNVATALLKSGDTVLFQGGATFTGQVYINAARSGITIDSYGNGKATIKASGGKNPIEIHEASNVTIKNIVVDATGAQHGILADNWNRNAQGTGIKIDGVDEFGASSQGILFTGDFKGWDNVRFVNCSTKNNGSATVNPWSNDGIAIISWYPNNTNIYIGHCVSSGNHGNGFTFSNVKNSTIEYCTAMYNWTQGFEIAPSNDNLLIQYNVATGNIGGPSDGAGIDLGWGVTNSTIQYNYCYKNNGSGIQYNQIPKQKQINANNVVRFNVCAYNGIRNNYGQIHLWGNIINAQVYNNTLIVAPASTITVNPPIPVTSGGNAVGLPSGIRIHNATQGDQFVNGAKFWNNIIVVSGNVPAIDITPQEIAGIKGMVFQGNNYWSNTASLNCRFGNTVCNTLEDIHKYGQEMLNGQPVGLNVPPNFVNIVDGALIYQLTPNSSLLGQGLDLHALFGVDPSNNTLAGPLPPQMNVGAL